ncbi:TIM barrel protein [Mesorhizobium sp. B2-4-14]|nr:TIM barrel protein [Mesorhizobium sp. B2-4-14]
MDQASTRRVIDMQSAIRFGLNRMCLPHRPLSEFLDLAVEVGAEAVELRNDLPGLEIADDRPLSEVRDLVQQSGLAIASVNCLEDFNALVDLSYAEKLITSTAELGAPFLVLCPLFLEGHGWSEAEAARNLRRGLKSLAPILSDHDVVGLVEPLGMPTSTLHSQTAAVDAIEDVNGWQNFAILHDTFQFWRAADTVIHYDRIGLVHVSGIAPGTKDHSDLREPDRGFVFAGDRARNRAQIRDLRDHGYDGVVSMEPFDPCVHDDPAIARRLKQSFDFLNLEAGGSRSE